MITEMKKLGHDDSKAKDYSLVNLSIDDEESVKLKKKTPAELRISRRENEKKDAIRYN